jgi:transposase-like protein
MSSHKRQKLSDGNESKFICQLCNKSYERADHLARHLDSRKLYMKVHMIVALT